MQEEIARAGVRSSWLTRDKNSFFALEVLDLAIPGQGSAAVPLLIAGLLLS